MGKDVKFWTPEGRKLREDVVFKKEDPDNLFGNETPDWPENVNEAKDKFIDQVETWGCPFEWLMPKHWKLPA